jgi:hypothetical protein
LPTTQTEKFLAGATEQITDDVVGDLNLAGLVPVDNFCQSGRIQIPANQILRFTGDRLKVTG